jgi:hypothetical protein
MVLFTQAFVAPHVPTQHANILLHKSLTSKLFYMYTNDQYNIA